MNPAGSPSTMMAAPPSTRAAMREEPRTPQQQCVRRALLLGGLHGGVLQGLRGSAFGGLLAVGAGCATPRQASSDVPAEAWPTSTPEALGFDSEALLRVFDVIDVQRLAINSLHDARTRITVRHLLTHSSGLDCG